MRTRWTASSGLLLLIAVIGCQSQGYDLELHVPREVSRIELTIDQAAGAAPRNVGKGVYAIDVDETGRATINSEWPISRFHRTFLVTPQGRLENTVDFHISASGWRMNTTTVRTRKGVATRTIFDGSVYWMEIRRKKARG